jgi:hypothetical protein
MSYAFNGPGWHGSNASLRPQRSDAIFSAAQALMQRKAHCACDGGCPRCASASSRPTIQTKLAISAPGDQYEQEADQVAEQIMHTPTAIQRSCAACSTGVGTCPKCEQEESLLQRKNGTASESTSSVHEEVLSGLSHGQPLDAATRAFFERRFNHDFSQVRVHSDAAAKESAQAVNALAYTFGQDIVFGAEQYAPGTTGGNKLLAHELTHVVQQSGGETMIQRESIDDCIGTENIHVTDAVTRAFSDINTALRLMDQRTTDDEGNPQLTTTVKNALWLAFRSDTDADAAAVRKRLSELKGQIVNAAFVCLRSSDPGYQGECSPTKVAFVQRGAGGGRHSKRTGPIFLCSPSFFDQPRYEMLSGTVIHEAMHRFQSIPDAGYFQSPGCLETARPTNSPSPEDPDSGTAGDSPSIRLDNADAYACFVHFLTHLKRQEMKESAQSYRGEGLEIKYASLAGEGFVIYTRTSSPASSSYRIEGAPANSGFRFRWKFKAGGKVFNLGSAVVADAGVFGETNSIVYFPKDLRSKLAAEKITGGTIICETEMFNPGEGQSAPTVTREYTVTVKDEPDPSNPPPEPGARAGPQEDIYAQ